ncbi:MAG: mobile mystery protein A [Deltaproteobacteria bacterium]|nr:mobile mystery protein A [Deltaproteobacteria bacterium]
MKIKPQTKHAQRRSLDQRIRELVPLAKVERPGTGWIRGIRESLGMTAAQLASRLGIKTASVLGLEEREVTGAITLEALERAARALNCKVVYALVPETTLDEMLDHQSHIAADWTLKEVSHSMGLESQKVSDKENASQSDELANLLKWKMSSKIWDIKWIRKPGK